MFILNSSESGRPTNAAPFKWTEYEDRIRKARLEDSSDILPNLSSAHASIVLNELIVQATETKRPLRIVSGELYPGCYDPLTKPIKTFLDSWNPHNNQTALKIILTDWQPESENANEFFKSIKPYTTGDNPNVTIKTTPITAPHFCVVGQHSYRFELDHTTMEARLSYNHSSLATKLANYFDELFDLSNDLGSANQPTSALCLAPTNETAKI